MEWLLGVLVATVGFVGWTASRRARSAEQGRGDPAGDTALIAGAWWWSSSGQGYDGDSGGHGGTSNGGWLDGLGGEGGEGGGGN